MMRMLFTGEYKSLGYADAPFDPPADYISDFLTSYIGTSVTYFYVYHSSNIFHIELLLKSLAVLQYFSIDGRDAAKSQFEEEGETCNSYGRKRIQ